MTNVPNSWAVVPIADVLMPNQNGKPFQQGWSPQCENHSASSEKWGVLKTTAIQPGQFWGHENKQLPDGLEPRLNIEVQEGDLLMTCAGPRSRCGVGCLVERTRPRLMISGKMYRFRPIADVMDSRFLAYFIQSRSAQVTIDRMKTGISDSGLNLTHDRFGALAVPVAPPREQRRIVAKIEELFSELDKGVESLTTAREQLEVFRLVVLHQAVSDASGSHFPTKLLNDLIGPIGQGWSPKCDVNTPAQDGEWAIIKTTAVQHMSYIPYECKPLPPDLQPRPGIEIQDGDLLMTRKGPRPRTGVVCYVRKARPHSMLCDTVYRFRAVEEVVLPEYLEIALNAPSIVQEINARKSGISESGISLNHGKLRSLPIPVPADFDSQRRIVQAVRQRLSIVDNAAVLIAEQAQRIEGLRQSILLRAFSGRLVAQEAGDEPASALLERIRGEQEDVSVKKQRNGKKEAA